MCKLTVIDSWLEVAFSDEHNLRATVARKNREEPDVETLFGKVTGVTDTGRQGDETTGAGNGADGEGTPAAKGVGRQGSGPPETADSRPGGNETMTKTGQWTGDDHWPNQVPERRLRCYVRYHLSITLGTGAGAASAWYAHGYVTIDGRRTSMP